MPPLFSNLNSSLWRGIASPDLAACNFQTRQPIVEIKSLEVACVPPRWGLLKLEGSNGIVGYGEFTLEGQTELTANLVKDLGDFIKVNKLDLRNPNRLIEAVRCKNFYNRDGMLWSAVAGIEMACWDILGKEVGKPIHELLGGKLRSRLLVYHWAGGNFDHGDSFEPAVAQVKALVDRGLKAIKLNACPPMHEVDVTSGVRQAIERMKAVREAVGPNILLAFDFHGRISPANAVDLARGLAQVNPFFIEEPVAPEHNNWLPIIAQSSGLRIATGERMFEPQQFASICSIPGSVHLLQPDLIHIGGISRTKMVADLATMHGIGCAPHCPMGPIAFMACAQVLASSVSGQIQECSDGIHYNEAAMGNPFRDYLTNPNALELDSDGCIAIPDGPGLGIELSWDKVMSAKCQRLPWKEPSPVAPDGQPRRW